MAGLKRGRGRPALMWRAVVGKVRGWGKVTPEGGLRLSLVLADAGTVSGREVTVDFTADELDALFTLVRKARKNR